jgi:serine/threonine protein kinase
MASESADSGVRRSVRIGKYEVLKHIATGGMGVVYKARDTQLGREVALKVLSPELAKRPAALERFRQEARHSARLRHENIVTLYEVGTDEAQGTHFLAMELVEGTDLDDYIAEKGHLAPDEAKEILLQSTRALEAAHRAGLVHRDIKPSNFLIAHTADGRPLVKLTDLGLAREVSDEEYRITRVGSTVGSIDYMSPEQARDSRSADIRSDIYSLGCTFFHMLTGQPPFGQGSLTERLFKHIEAEPPDPRDINPAVPKRLVKVLRKMLAKRPDERFQSPAELIAALTRKSSGRRKPAAEAPAEPRAEAPPPKRPRTPDLTVPELPPPAPKPRRQAAPTPGQSSHDSDVFPPGSPEQSRAAAGQFERAAEVLGHGNYEYGLRLLASCCKLDPANLMYRQALRKAQKAKHRNTPPNKTLGWLTGLPSRARLKTAKRIGDHQRVLELGEEMLNQNPWDLGTQMDMAAAAEGLGLLNLAAWILEEARQTERKDLNLQRALARVYEKLGKLSTALALWESVRKAAPDDGDAHRKAQELAARDTIARGGYQEQILRATRRSDSDPDVPRPE